jgi:sec-independent protein translocase protein TatA
MFGLGFGELLIVLFVVLIVFGAGKLPQIGDQLGRSIKNFRRSASGESELEVSQKRELPVKAAPPPALEDAEVVKGKKS